MFKRSDDGLGNNSAIPPKRAKFDFSDGRATTKRPDPNKKSSNCDDVWGDDFAEEDIEEMDFIVSQACSQDNVNIPHKEDIDTMCTQRISIASTSKRNNTITRLLETSATNSLKLESPIGNVSKNVRDKDYVNFERKLLNNKLHNSTFLPQGDVLVPDTAWTKEFDKLKAENERLLNDFITKDGETAFLRHQLQQAQLRAENDRLEKTRFIEEQAKRHRAEINTICKEKEKLKTQLDLQMLEVASLVERCKLLGTGNISLLEPHTATVNSSNTNTNRGIGWIPSTVKTETVTEKSLQTEYNNKTDYYLKACHTHYPLVKMSELAFGTSSFEKSVVEIQVIEKTGRRNLPILQEEDRFRIFENPDIVKPMVTKIGDRKLSIEFVLPDLVVLQRKTSLEINSESCVPIINKLVLMTRELLINSTVVLRTIFQAMKNDDIRDMDDLYFSDAYKIESSCTKSVCDAKCWYDEERGIETRRALGVLAHIAKESSYLGKYIAGKTVLFVQEDEDYKRHIIQMIRYNTWPKRGCEFEMLEIILELATLIGLIRRSHQFSGVITAVAQLLCNVQKRIGFCEKGMDYVVRIFKELVFSRPLSLCYVPLAELMMTFIGCNYFVRNLCKDSRTVAVMNWKGALHFTPDVCILQILMAQMENACWDYISIINVSYAMVHSVKIAIQKNGLPLKTDSSKSCNCCIKLIAFTINMLSKCSKMNLDNVQYTRAKDMDRNFWTYTKRKQHSVLREGIKCLCHLATRDPDIIVRLSDIEDSFHIFMQNIGALNDLVLHESERDALNLIKSAFILDKLPQTESQSHQARAGGKQMSVRANFEKRQVPKITKNTRHANNEDIDKIITNYKILFNKKLK